MNVQTQRVQGPIYSFAAEALHIGISLRRENGVLAPFLLVWGEEGVPTYVDITEAPSPEHVVSAAEQLVPHLPDVEAYAIVFDGRITVDSEDPEDAVIARVGVSGGEQGIVTMQRYETNDAGDTTEPYGRIGVVGYGDNLLNQTAVEEVANG